MFCVGITFCLSQHQTHNKHKHTTTCLDVDEYSSLFLQFLISPSLYENTTASVRGPDESTDGIDLPDLAQRISQLLDLLWCDPTVTTPRCPTVLDWIQVWEKGGQVNTISTPYTRMWSEPLVLLPSRPPPVTLWGCDVSSLTHCQSSCLVSGWDHSAHVQASSPDTYSSTGEGLDPFSPGAEGGPAQTVRKNEGREMVDGHHLQVCNTGCLANCFFPTLPHLCIHEVDSQPSVLSNWKRLIS